MKKIKHQEYVDFDRKHLYKHVKAELKNQSKIFK